MMENVKLMIDSGSDISRQLAEELDIEVVPLFRMVDGHPIEDFYDFDINAYSAYLKTCKEIPSTSQPSPEAFLQRFERFAPNHDHILCITMSVHGSGTYNSACIARDMFVEHNPDARCQIHIVDSWSCSLNEVLEIRLAHRLIGEGRSMEQVLEELDQVRRRVQTYYLIDNIDFLIKGGRVSTLKGSIASKLRIKPIVSIKNGMGSTSNALGYNNGLSKLAHHYLSDCNENGELYVSHAGCPEKAMDIVNKIRETYPDLRYHIFPMLGTMSTQSGPDSIGIFYCKNK